MSAVSALSALSAVQAQNTDPQQFANQAAQFDSTDRASETCNERAHPMPPAIEQALEHTGIAAGYAPDTGWCPEGDIMSVSSEGARRVLRTTHRV